MNNFLQGAPLPPHQFVVPDTGSWERRQSLKEQQTQTRIAGEARDLAQEARDAATLSAEHAARQTALLTAMRQLSEDLAGERRDSAEREGRQQTFNKRMTILASVLAGAAVVVPFGILWIEQMLKSVTP